MLRNALLIAGLLLAGSFANSKPTAYQQSLSCKANKCPYTYEFIKTAKVKKTLVTSFNNSGISTPAWLFSSYSVTIPIEPLYKGKVRYVKIFTCKPHACNSDYLEGYYNTSTNSFSGVYREDGNDMRIQ